MEGEISNVIIYATVIMLVFIIIIVLFILFYRNRRRYFLREQEHITQSLQRELLKAKIEVQEQTLQHFCRELHDDIGQKLSVVRIYINKLESGKSDPAEKEQLAGISSILGEAIGDLRNAVHTLSPDAINRFGFAGSLSNELSRINKTGLIKCTLNITGEHQEIFTPQQELLLFRICQEFIQNSMKHAECSLVIIDIHYDHAPFSMQLQDNGRGFDVSDNFLNERGSGIRNMINRAKMLGGTLKIQSQAGAGTSVYLTLPLN